MLADHLDLTVIVKRDKHLLPYPDRFWARVERSEGCWIWTGGQTSKGYGCLVVDSKAWLTHRYSYTLTHGPIPDGLTIDHLCRVKLCQRPDHLEAVPGRVNTLRGNSPSAINARRAICVNGHSLIPENLRYRTKRFGRICRACHAEMQRNYRVRMAYAKHGILKYKRAAAK